MMDWIVGGVILIAVVAALRYIWKQHRQGKCAGGCAGCHGCCHGQTDVEKQEIK